MVLKESQLQVEKFFDFVAENDIRIKGRRIGIESVLYEYVHRAQTAEEIAARFPTLSLEEIYATILFYLHNQEAVSQYLANWLAHGARARADQAQNPNPAVQALRRLKVEQTIPTATT